MRILSVLFLLASISAFADQNETTGDGGDSGEHPFPLYESCVQKCKRDNINAPWNVTKSCVKVKCEPILQQK